MLFATFLASAINRNAATSTETLVLDYLLAGIGIAIFVIAMMRPKWLPGHNIAERDEEDRHQREIALEGKKEGARRMRSFTDPWSTDRGQREHTDAMNRLSAAFERQEQKGGRDDSANA